MSSAGSNPVGFALVAWRSISSRHDFMHIYPIIWRSGQACARQVCGAVRHDCFSMVYFVIKCALSGIIIAVVSEVAKRSPAFWGADRFVASGIAVGNSVALARYRRCRADRQSRGINILVRPAVAADVPGSSGDAPGRGRFLVEHGRKLRPYNRTVRRHRSASGQIWDQYLRRRSNRSLAPLRPAHGVVGSLHPQHGDGGQRRVGEKKRSRPRRDPARRWPSDPPTPRWQAAARHLRSSSTRCFQRPA